MSTATNLPDVNVLVAARDLCADAGNTEYVRGIAELIIDLTVGLDQDKHKDALIKFLGAPLVDPNGPLTADQRKSLFASWSVNFTAEASRENRHAFTKAVLGDDVNPSWRDVGGITAGQADRLLRAMEVVSHLI